MITAEYYSKFTDLLSTLKRTTLTATAQDQMIRQTPRYGRPSFEKLLGGFQSYPLKFQAVVW